MESRWFLFPGQTLQNTKIEDRGHALHITGDAWENIKRHLDRKKAVREMLEKEESKRRYLDEGSKNMIKNWDNSLENITKRKEEERLRLIESRKEERMQSFFNMRKEQEAIRKEYVNKVQKRMFRNTGISRDLTSSFRTSEVLYEREKQKEFQRFIKAHEDEEDAKYAELVNENAKIEYDEKKEKARKLYENKKQYGKHLMSVITEHVENERKAKEVLHKKEVKDNLRSIEEMQIIKMKEAEEVVKKKKEFKADLQKHIDAEHRRQELLKQEDKEKDEVVAIYQEAKHRIDCLKKDKEKELQDAIIERREAVIKLVVAEDSAKAELEEKILKAAIAERDAIEEEKVKAKAEHAELMRQELLDNRVKCILREKEAQRRETEIKKWEMLNRYKNDEVTRQYEEQRKQEQWQKILKNRADLLEQMDENEKKRLLEKEIDAFNAAKNFDGDDAQFFDYADEVLELAKKTGRSTYPIEKVIMGYKRINSLKVPVCEQSNCEDYTTGAKKSMSREIVKNSTKKRTCKCNRDR